MMIIDINNIETDEDIKETMILENSYLRRKSFEEGMLLYNKLLEPGITEKVCKLNYAGTSYVYPQYMYNYYEKVWRGQSLKNKTLLVFRHPCGYGDVIMYARYIPILAKKAKKIILEVRESLLDFYRYNFPYCEIIEDSGREYDGEYDYTTCHEYFLNLQKDFKKFPSPEGYLKIDPQLVEKYGNLPEFDTKKKKIGIFFSNNKKHRSVDKDAVIPIVQNTNFQFYSLNRGKPSEEIIKFHKKYGIIRLNDYLTSINDTAAIMKNLDLVISIDSFPIHLAGALGIKSYLILPFDNDWRWFEETETTAWYNSVRIFKRQFYNSWLDISQQIAHALEIEFL